MKAEPSVVALANTKVKKQAETIIQRLFKLIFKALVDALADTVADKEPKTLIKHCPTSRPNQ